MTALAIHQKQPNCPSTGDSFIPQYILRVEYQTTWKNQDSLLGAHPREIKTYAHKKTCTEPFITPLFVIPPNCNGPKVHQQRNRQIVLYSYNGILLRDNNKRNHQIHTATGMNFKSVLLSKIGHKKSMCCRILLSVKFNWQNQSLLTEIRTCLPRRGADYRKGQEELCRVIESGY